MKKLVGASLLVILLLAMSGCGDKSKREGFGDLRLSHKGEVGAEYDKGYDDGYARGYVKGNQDFIDGNEFNAEPSSNPGYADAYADGYDAGYWAGYHDGFNDAEALKSKAEEESPPGTSKADDYEKGSRDGYRVGYEHAKEDWVQGWGYYEPSPKQDFIEKFCYGRSDSYVEGWVDGFEDGYLKGWNSQEQPGSGL